jgi:Xaa-Pro dipeptidase
LKKEDNEMEYMKKEAYSIYPVSVAALKEERYERTRRMMADQDLDVILTFSFASISQRANVRFLTNYAPTTRYAGVVFPKEGDPVLLVPYPVHIGWARQTTWVEDIRLTSDFLHEIKAILKERGYEKGHIGLAGQVGHPVDMMPPAFHSELRRLLPQARIENVAEPFSQMRVVKSPDESKLVSKSSEIADKAFKELPSILKPGLTQYELVAEAEYILRKQGAEYVLVLVGTAGTSSHPVVFPRPFEKGDVISFSVEVAGPGGYWIQTVRTLSLGEPSPKVREAVELCTRTQEQVASDLMPGKPIGQACKAGEKLFLEGGAIEESDLPRFFGHGMGLDLGIGPRIQSDNPEILQTGSVIAIHPSFLLDGQQIFTGDLYLVEEGGLKKYSKIPGGIMVL